LQLNISLDFRDVSFSVLLSFLVILINLFLEALLDTSLQGFDIILALFTDSCKFPLQIVITLSLGHEYVFILTISVTEVRQLIDILRQCHHLMLRVIESLVLSAIEITKLVLITVDKLPLNIV
jgi:hypothetical protein